MTFPATPAPLSDGALIRCARDWRLEYVVCEFGNADVASGG